MANYQELLSNLLAVIHADGGHYEAEHGTVKAVTDAIEKVFEMKAHLTQRAADLPMCSVCGETIVFKKDLCEECYLLSTASR